MDVVFATLIVHHMKTFSQVPVSLQPMVQAELLVLGCGTDGNPIVVG